MASTKNSPANNAASNAPPSPRPDRGLFLNLTGALFGEGKLQQVLSPTRTGETFFGKSTSGEKVRKASTPGGSNQLGGGEDVFTQFSQYGSRAHLAQPDQVPEPPSGTRRKTSFDLQLRTSEQRRQRKTEAKGGCRSREKSCEEVVIRVTDTEAETEVVQPILNSLQTSRLVAPQQQSQAQQQHQQHHHQHQQHHHHQQLKEPEQEVHPEFELKEKFLQESLQKPNSNSHCQPAEDPQQGHHGDAPQDRLDHPQGHPDASSHQDAAAAQSQSHRNALGHNFGLNPNGASSRWAKKKAPKMPPLLLGGGEGRTTESIRSGLKDARVVKGLGDKVLLGGRGISARSDSDSGIEAGDTNSCDGKIKQVDIQREYDLVQLIGEGWFSRVYLAERRSTREEVVLKAINSDLVTAEEFWREHQSSAQLWPHKHILRVYDTVFQSDGYFMFATEYAPLGDLTSNITEAGLGEQHTKRVAKQIGSALEWIHLKGLCHLDVKLDNILVFRSDFSLVKLCDFGSVRSAGDIVIKKNELLPYCPAELVARHANEYYQVDRVQDVFQFGIVVFYCLQGILPWQKADLTDPYFTEFCCWRSKRNGKVPRNFKAMTSRAQKLFRKVLDPEPEKRLQLEELGKYLTDRWLKKEYRRPEGRDGQSQLTLGSFQSVHSNAVEKNRMLYTLLQHGVETTVDRSLKNNRIISWIKQGAERVEGPATSVNDVEEEEEEEPEDILKANADSEDIEDMDSCCDEPRC